MTGLAELMRYDGRRVVVTGCVEIRDRAQVIATQRPNDFFGELALFDQEPRSADAVTVEDTVLLEIGGAEAQHRPLGGHPHRELDLAGGAADGHPIHPVGVGPRLHHPARSEGQAPRRLVGAGRGDVGEEIGRGARVQLQRLGF